MTEPVERSNDTAPDTSDIVGTATMQDDRTLVLDLYADRNTGLRGTAQLRYAPDHPQYGEILAHIEGLEPGGTKPVPAWPDDD